MNFSVFCSFGELCSWNHCENRLIGCRGGNSSLPIFLSTLAPPLFFGVCFHFCPFGSEEGLFFFNSFGLYQLLFFIALELEVETYCFPLFSYVYFSQLGLCEHLRVSGFGIQKFHSAMLVVFAYELETLFFNYWMFGPIWIMGFNFINFLQPSFFNDFCIAPFCMPPNFHR